MPNTQSKRDHYLANREFYIQQAKDKRAERKAFIIAYKEDKPCADCGNFYPHYVMDFDHITGDKDRNVSKMASASSMRKMLEEIEKCEVVCANCHRIRTFNRGYYNGTTNTGM